MRAVHKHVLCFAVQPPSQHLGYGSGAGRPHDPRQTQKQQMRTNTRQNARRRVVEQDHHHRPKGDGPGRAEQDEADPISD